MVRDMTQGKTFCPTSTLVCKPCIEGKQYATKCSNDAERLATKALEVVYSGSCGPKRNMSIGRAMYFVSFIDDVLEESVDLYDDMQIKTVLKA